MLTAVCLQEGCHLLGKRTPIWLEAALFIRASYEPWAANMPSLWGMALACEVLLSEALPKTLLRYPAISMHFPHSSALASFLIMWLFHCPQMPGQCPAFARYRHFQSDLPLGTAVSPGHWHCRLALWPLYQASPWLPGSVSSCRFCSSLPAHFCPGSKLVKDPLHWVPLYLLNGYPERSKLHIFKNL